MSIGFIFISDRIPIGVMCNYYRSPTEIASISHGIPIDILKKSLEFRATRCSYRVPGDILTNSKRISMLFKILSYPRHITFQSNDYTFPIKFLSTSYGSPPAFLLDPYRPTIGFLSNSHRNPVEFQLKSYRFPI